MGMFQRVLRCTRCASLDTPAGNHKQPLLRHTPPSTSSPSPSSPLCRLVCLISLLSPSCVICSFVSVFVVFFVLLTHSSVLLFAFLRTPVFPSPISFASFFLPHAIRSPSLTLFSLTPCPFLPASPSPSLLHYFSSPCIYFPHFLPSPSLLSFLFALTLILLPQPLPLPPPTPHRS